MALFPSPHNAANPGSTENISTSLPRSIQPFSLELSGSATTLFSLRLSKTYVVCLAMLGLSCKEDANDPTPVDASVGNVHDAMAQRDSFSAPTDVVLPEAEAGILVPCNDGTGQNTCCPPSAAVASACDAPDLACFTSCRDGVRGQMFCLGGKWESGQGLIPCGSDS